MKNSTRRATDWIEVRARLNDVAAGGPDALRPDPHAIDVVYRRRAGLLAAREVQGSRTRTLPVLAFAVGSERYAIELAVLAEVLPYRGCVAVPGAPPLLLGVINVRGEIRSVADLHRMLDLPPADHRPNGYVVMFRDEGRALGFRVDRVDQVLDIEPADLQSARDTTMPVQTSRLVKALTTDGLILLDTSAVVAQFIRTGA